MRVMKFSIRTMLGIVAVIALWFSTFAMKDDWWTFGIDLRFICRMAIFLCAAANVLYAQGARRAFWIGFAFVWVLHIGAAALQMNGLPLDYNIERLASNLTEN